MGDYEVWDLAFWFLEHTTFAVGILFWANVIRSYFDWRLHRDRQAWNYIGLSFFAGLYSLLTWGCMQYQGIPFTQYIIDWMWFSAIFATYFYFQAVGRFVEVSNRVFQGLRRVVFGLGCVASINIVTHAVFDLNLFTRPEPIPNPPRILIAGGGALTTPTFLLQVVGAVSILSVLFGLAILWVWIFKRYQREKFLLMGVTFSLIAVLNEILMTFGWIDFIPLMFLSKGLEVIRVGKHYQTQAYARVQKLEKDAEALSRKAASAFIAGGIVHDLRNPLAVMQGQMSLLLRKLEAGGFDQANWEETLLRIQGMVKQTHRMDEIIWGYLNLLKKAKDSGVRLVSTEELIQGALDLTAPRRSHTRFQNLPMNPDRARPVQVRVNPTLIELVLANLINNSVEVLSSVPSGEIQIGVNVVGAE